MKEKNKNKSYKMEKIVMKSAYCISSQNANSACGMFFFKKSYLKK